MLRKLSASPLSILFILFLATGFVVALLPPSGLVDMGGGRDKLIHFTAFTLFALFGFNVWPTRIPAVILLLLGYGLAMELVQDLTGHRLGDALDFLADMCGVFAALSIRSMWMSLRPSPA